MSRVRKAKAACGHCGCCILWKAKLKERARWLAEARRFGAEVSWRYDLLARSIKATRKAGRP